MRNLLAPLCDKLLLRRGTIIETINEQLKSISHIAHTLHCSVHNGLVNLFAGPIATPISRRNQYSIYCCRKLP